MESAFMCLEQALVEFLLPWLGNLHLLAHAAAGTGVYQGFVWCRSIACRRIRDGLVWLPSYIRKQN